MLSIKTICLITTSILFLTSETSGQSQIVRSQSVHPGTGARVVTFWMTERNENVQVTLADRVASIKVEFVDDKGNDQRFVDSVLLSEKQCTYFTIRSGGGDDEVRVFDDSLNADFLSSPTRTNLAQPLLLHIDLGCGDNCYRSDAFVDSIISTEGLEPGSNLVTTGPANDVIYGGNGRDVVYAGDGRDVIFGRDGRDILYGEGGSDRIFGGNGNDILHGGRDLDRLYGNAGDDCLLGDYDGHDDAMEGGVGTDDFFVWGVRPGQNFFAIEDRTSILDYDPSEDYLTEIDIRD